MIKALKHITLIATVMLLFSACQKDDGAETEYRNEPVNLSISLAMPEIALDTRSSANVSSDPHNDDGTWTKWDEVVDGRYLYHVTLLLVEKTTKKLVGIRDIHHGSEHITDSSSDYGANGFSSNGIVNTSATDGTEVTFNFRYDHPRHGMIEKLRRGEFRMIIVANHAPYTYGSNSYDGLVDSDGNKLKDLIDKIKEDFDITNGKGIDNFEEQYPNLYNFKISATKGLRSDNDPQPLTVVKDISLNPGENSVSAELKRTYARIRIEVLNNSSSCDLTINSLSFSNNFAQEEAYLLDLPEDEDRKYEPGEVAPATNSDYTITPFTASSASPITLSPHERKVIYDAYILESRDNDNSQYKYTLDVEYKGKTYTTPPIISDSPIARTDIENYYYDASDSDIKYAFTIQNKRSGKNLYQTDDNKLYQGAKTNRKLEDITDYAYIWVLIEENDRVYIRNMNDLYIDYPNGGNTQLTNMRSDAACFKFTDHKDGGVGLRAYDGNYNTNTNTYLNDYGSAGANIGGYGGGRNNDNADDGGSSYNLYLMEMGEETDARYTSPIVLHTIDSQTAQVSPVTSIKRNDFINVLVTVAYDEMNGDFKFDVTPWQEKQGSIEFN